MKKTLLGILGAGIITIISSCEKDCPEGCIDRSKVGKIVGCTANYAPVCGCDKKTYSNNCEAEAAGLTSYTNGKCN